MKKKELRRDLFEIRVQIELCKDPIELNKLKERESNIIILLKKEIRMELLKEKNVSDDVCIDKNEGRGRLR